MSIKRSGPAVCVYEGKIYVFGGHGIYFFVLVNAASFKISFFSSKDGPLVHKSAECYDPKTNTWEQIAEMNIGRRNSSK
jgi:hypothetical protein